MPVTNPASLVSASRIVVDFAAYPTLTLTVRVGNGGRVAAPSGVPVAFYDDDPAVGGVLLATTVTERSLAPGAFVDLTVEVPFPGLGAISIVARVGDDGAGGGGRRECDLTNNQHLLDTSTEPVGLLAAIEFEQRGEVGDAAGAVRAEAEAQGVIFRPIGDTLAIAPPYVITPEELDHVMDVMATSIEATIGASS